MSAGAVLPAYHGSLAASARHTQVKQPSEQEVLRARHLALHQVQRLEEAWRSNPAATGGWFGGQGFEGAAPRCTDGTGRQRKAATECQFAWGTYTINPGSARMPLSCCHSGGAEPARAGGGALPGGAAVRGEAEAWGCLRGDMCC